MDGRAPHMRPASSLRLIPRNATWKKRQWKPAGTREDPWGPRPLLSLFASGFVVVSDKCPL